MAPPAQSALVLQIGALGDAQLLEQKDVAETSISTRARPPPCERAEVSIDDMGGMVTQHASPRLQPSAPAHSNCTLLAHALRSLQVPVMPE
jgi:hypothetical protein